MTWVPLVTAILQAILLILQALSQPQSVLMSVMTIDGRWTTLPCKVVPRGHLRAKITANYLSDGTPIAKAVITIGGMPYARAYFFEGSQRVTAGPVELGDTF